MKEKILEFLKQQDGFISGQRICDELGVSRTAVWKYMNSLKKEGYEIESVTRKGYRLLQSPDLLTKEAVLSCMKEVRIPGEFCCFESIDSTNEEAKRRGEAGAPDGSVYVADNQTSGKGRRGRTWISPAGEDIFFTILLRPELPLSSVSMITLVAASAVSGAIDKVTGLDSKIKWPNDIVLNRKKVCGILTEMNMEIDSVAYVVVGIGINVNRMEFREDIADMATSLKKESGHTVERAALLSEILSAFFRDYKLFLEEQNLSSFLEYYNQKLINAGREVRLIKKGEEVIRTAIGINDRGELIVRDDEGNTEHIFSGEVSVRGIYGYV